MLISRITYNNHPILGNLDLDLVNTTTGKPFNTVIFAGENGTGKTTILESLSHFLNQNPMVGFKRIKYFIGNDEYTAEPLSEQKKLDKGFYRIRKPDGQYVEINSGIQSGSLRHQIQEELNNNLSIRSYGNVYSKARADYKTIDIKSTTTSNVDNSIKQTDESDDYTSLKQLLVDIETRDNESYRDLNRQNPTNPLSETDFERNSLMHRFRNAFNTFFDTIKFDKIDTLDNNKKDIVFRKGPSRISIDNLSTGEKQIVYRGAYLLKNQRKMEKGTVFIDEPELSMHPKWARRILTYFRNLFTDVNGIQTSQIFLATHSEHVITQALKDKDNCLIIVLRNEGGLLIPQRIDAPSKLSTITSAETNYLAFDLYTNDYHIELYGTLQNKIRGIDHSYTGSVKKTDEYIESQPSYNSSVHQKISVHPSGAPTYNTICTLVRNHIDHPDSAPSFTEEDLVLSTELLRSLLP